MLGDDKTSVFGAKIAVLFETGSSNYGYGAALSFVLLALVLIVMVISTLLTKKTDKAAVKGGKA